MSPLCSDGAVHADADTAVLGSYQYRHGKTTTEASKTLYAEGGLPRFWAGLPAALVQGPVGEQNFRFEVCSRKWN